MLMRRRRSVSLRVARCVLQKYRPFVNSPRSKLCRNS